jgi:sorbitol-specific phosphotransferase system component IIBC
LKAVGTEEVEESVRMVVKKKEEGKVGKEEKAEVEVKVGRWVEKVMGIIDAIGDATIDNSMDDTVGDGEVEDAVKGVVEEVGKEGGVPLEEYWEMVREVERVMDMRGEDDN